MKNRIKLIGLIVFSFLFLNLNRVPIFANYVNENVTVTVSQSWSTPAAGFYFVYLNGEVFTNGEIGSPTSGNYPTSFSIPITFVPNSVGTYTVTVTFDVSDESSNVVVVPDASQSVTVTTRPTTPEPTPDPTPTPSLSDNYYLSALSVDPGVLSPAFTSGNDTYYVTLPKGTETYSVYATVDDSTASVISGVGNGFLVGDISFLHRVLVQAQNGNMWEYHIYFSMPDDRSDNSLLKSLSVSKGKLSPAFNAHTTQYEVEVPIGTEKVTINAEVEDENATLTIPEFVEIKADESVTADVVVTAENGTSTIYNVVFTVADMPEQKIVSGGTTYTFDYEIPDGIEKIGFTKLSNLEGFEKGTPYFENKSKTHRVVYLNDGKQSDFYILEQDKDNVVGSKLVLIEINEKTYGFIDLPHDELEQPQTKLVKIDFDGIEIEGFSYLDEKLDDYLMLYLIDESGEPDFYLFDEVSTNIMKLGEFRLLDPKLVKEEKEDEVVEEDSEVKPPVLADRSVILLVASLLLIVIIVALSLFIRHRRSY